MREHPNSEFTASTLRPHVDVDCNGRAAHRVACLRAGWFVAVAVLPALVAPAGTQNLFGGANGSTLTKYGGIIVKQPNGSLSTLPVQAGFHLTNNNLGLVSQTLRMGFRLVDGVGNSVTQAVSGSLAVDSDIHFDIGTLDNYLYAEASGSILSFDAQVKGFVGRTTQDFHFTATGKYTPPPLAPPPGFFVVNSLDF